MDPDVVDPDVLDPDVVDPALMLFALLLPLLSEAVTKKTSRWGSSYHT